MHGSGAYFRTGLKRVKVRELMNDEQERDEAESRESPEPEADRADVADTSSDDDTAPPEVGDASDEESGALDGDDDGGDEDLDDEEDLDEEEDLDDDQDDDEPIEDRTASRSSAPPTGGEPGGRGNFRESDLFRQQRRRLESTLRDVLRRAVEKG